MQESQYRAGTINTATTTTATMVDLVAEKEAERCKAIRAAGADVPSSLVEYFIVKGLPLDLAQAAFAAYEADKIWCSPCGQATWRHPFYEEPKTE